jgi:hypothetical protein
MTHVISVVTIMLPETWMQWCVWALADVTWQNWFLKCRLYLAGGGGAIERG